MIVQTSFVLVILSGVKKMFYGNYLPAKILKENL